MKNMNQKIPVEIPKPLIHIGKLQSLLRAIGVNLYMKKLNGKLLPLLKKTKQKSTRKGGCNNKKI